MIGIAFLAAVQATEVEPSIVAEAPAIESPLEGLAHDAAEYAKLYPMPLAQAVQRLIAQEASVAYTDALAKRYRDRFAGIWLEHEPAFRFVILLTGDAPVADTQIVAGGLAIPIVFRTGALATRDQILAAITLHQAEIRAAVPRAPGMGVDPRTGRMIVMLRKGDLDKGGAEATAARLAAIAGVPVEVRPWADADRNSAAEGGGRVVGQDEDGHHFLCTSGFVVTDGAQTGLATAAHCPDNLAYVEHDRKDVPLTLLGAWGARYQDVQILSAPLPLDPLFHADSKETARRLLSWRLRESTRAGDVVCHRGEKTGYSCAEVMLPDYAPPGDLCAGNCMPTWVAVKGPDCKGGDSGGPVFLGAIAFGMVKGDSVSDGKCRLYYYMSTDYLPPGWTLLH